MSESERVACFWLLLLVYTMYNDFWLRIHPNFHYIGILVVLNRHNNFVILKHTRCVAIKDDRLRQDFSISTYCPSGQFLLVDRHKSTTYPVERERLVPSPKTETIGLLTKTHQSHTWHDWQDVCCGYSARRYSPHCSDIHTWYRRTHFATFD